MLMNGAAIDAYADKHKVIQPCDRCGKACSEDEMIFFEAKYKEGFENKVAKTKLCFDCGQKLLQAIKIKNKGKTKPDATTPVLPKENTTDNTAETTTKKKKTSWLKIDEEIK